MVYYALTNSQLDNFNSIITDKGRFADDWNQDATRMIGKRKAELVAEAARLGESIGEDEIRVYNITIQDGLRDNGIVYFRHEKPILCVPQSWYVFKENGQWFFKMYKECKTKHLIEL